MFRMNTCNCKKCGAKLQSSSLGEFMSDYEEGYFCHYHKKWLSQEDRNVVFDTHQIADYPQMSKATYVGRLLYFAYRHKLVEYLKLLNGLAQLLPPKSQIEEIIHKRGDFEITKHSDCLKYITTIGKDNINLFTDRKNIIKGIWGKNPIGDTNKNYRLIGKLLRQKPEIELFPFRYILQSKVKEFIANNKNIIKKSDVNYISILRPLPSKPDRYYVIKEKYKDKLDPIMCSIPFKIKGKTGKTEILVLDDYIIRKLFVLNFTEFKECLAFIHKRS